MPVERLILPEWESRDYNILSQACAWMGIDVIWADRSSLEGIPPDCPIEGTALRGGTTFRRQVASLLGGRVLEPSDDFLSSLPWELVNRRVELMTLAAARAITGERFVKPVNDKHFPAAVYERGADLPTTELGDDILVLTSDPVVWDAVEYRLFVLDREIRAISPYSSVDGHRPDPQMAVDARSFGERVLADPRVLLPRAVVLDVGVIAGSGWSVVEANTAVMSGIYDCEPLDVLEVLEAGLTD